MSTITTAPRSANRAATLLQGTCDLASGVLVSGLFAAVLPLLIPQIRRLLLAAIILDIPLRIDTNIGYRYDIEGIGGIPGFNFSITTIALAALYAEWIAVIVARRNPRSAVPWRAVRPLATYFLFVCASTLVASDVFRSLREVFLLSQMFLLYIYIVRRIHSRDDLFFVFTCLVIGFVLESGLILMAVRSGTSFAVPGATVTIDADGSGRVGGTLGSANAAGAYLSILLAPIVCWMLVSGGFRKVVGAAAVALGFFALIVTQTRGGWIAAAVSLLLFYGPLIRRRRVSIAGPLVIATILLIAALAFPDVIQHRLKEDDGGSAESRIPLMRTAARMIVDHPVLGVGANNYGAMLDSYTATSGWTEWIWTVHNKFLLVFAEGGIGALLAFIWFLTATVRQGWQTWKKGDRALSMFALACTAAIIGHLVHLQLDLFSGREQVQLLWLMCALVVSLRYMTTPVAVARSSTNYAGALGRPVPRARSHSQIN
jgi:O-antigen ligase